MANARHGRVKGEGEMIVFSTILANFKILFLMAIFAMAIYAAFAAR